MRRVLAVGRTNTNVVWFIVLVILPLALFLYVTTHPAMRLPPRVAQKAQFHSIEAALELFANEFQGHPPSEANDVAGLPYCGAMKLAEAVMGQDLLGYHPKSAFRADGLDPCSLTPFYPANLSGDDVRARRGPYLPPESANAYRLADIYGKGNTGPFPEDALVLCDTYPRRLPNGKKAGMPILYYRANHSGTTHDANNPDDPQNIYNYRDNLALIALGVPGDPNAVHPLADPRRSI